MLKAILFNDTSHNKHHGCQIVVKQIYELAAAAGIRIVRACPMRHDWRDDLQLQKDIASADLCMINGEGTLHDDERAARARIAFDDAERLAVANFVRGSRQQAQQMFVEIGAAVIAAHSPQGHPQ